MRDERVRRGEARKKNTDTIRKRADRYVIKKNKKKKTNEIAKKRFLAIFIDTKFIFI